MILNDATIKIDIPEDKRFLSIGVQEIYENNQVNINILEDLLD